MDYSRIFDHVDHSKLWILLKEIGVSQCMIVLLHNLNYGEEATVRIKYGETDRFPMDEGIR